MRNPERIDRILEEIKQFWNENPDWRLGQVLCNFGRRAGRWDPFYLEDEKLEELLKQYFEDPKEFW